MTRIGLACIWVVAACNMETSAGPDGGPAAVDARSGGAVATIVVTPASATVAIGDPQSFAAEARDASGVVVNGVTFTWTSSNPSVATIDSGVAMGVSEGTTRIAAHAGGIDSNEVTLTVTTSPTPGGESSGDLIDAALAAGRIDEETALTYKIFAAFADPRLPEEFRGDDSGMFETLALEQLQERFDTLSGGAQDTLGAFLLRPAALGSWAEPSQSQASLVPARPTCRGESSGWTSDSTSSAHVKVWYQFAIAGDKAKAEIVSNAIEQKIWSKLIDGLLLSAPPSDFSSFGCYGGDTRLDVYIVHNVAFRGLTQPEGFTNTQAPTYTMLNVDKLSDAELPGAMAHELMHAIQWSYQTRSSQQSYGWLRDATANWAIDAVYGKTPGNQVEQTYADCFMSTPALPLQDRTSGHCSRWSDPGRDYGAYLLFQYIAKTSSEATVANVVKATTSAATGVEAVDSALAGKLKDTYPKFAKTMWNKAPLDAKPDSFKTWDGLADAAKGRDLVGDLGGASEATENLEAEQPDLSSRYYHFTFTDVNARSVLFYNGFFDQQKAGKAIKVLAVWQDAAGNWQEEDWSTYEFVGLCRDAKAQRAMDLTIIVANGEWSPGGGGKVTATKAPYLKRSNFGCWKFQGTGTFVYKHSSWTGTGKTITSNLVFGPMPGADALDAKHPNFPDTLRVGTSVILPVTGTDYTVTESYSTGTCSFSAGPFTFPLGAIGNGIMFTNPFPELKSADSSLQSWLAQAPRAYMGAVSDTAFFEVTVTGTGCHSPEMDIAGGMLLTNEVVNDVAVNPPLANANGSLIKSFTYLENNFTWTLQPQTQP